MNTIVPHGAKGLITQRLRGAGRARLNWATPSFSWMFNQWRTSCTAAVPPLVLMLGILLLIGGTFVNLAVADTYYMSPSEEANDNNAGTLSAPWKTFQESLGKLEPGDTLILKEGTYNALNSGYPKIIGNSNPKNLDDLSAPTVMDGLDGQPITVKAEDERKAFIEGTGEHHTVHIENLSHWKFEGIYAKSADFELPPGSKGTVFFVKNSEHLEFKRLLLTHNNRWQNSHLLLAWYCDNILVEESEFYWFHRHGINFAHTTNSVARRNYLNSRGYTDIPESSPGAGDGGRKSIFYHHGDSAVSIYPGVDNTVENVISEGQARLVEINAPDPATGNKILGSISLNEVQGFIFDARGKTTEEMPRNTELIDNVVVNPTNHGVFSRAAFNTIITNLSIFGGDTGIEADDYFSPSKPEVKPKDCRSTYVDDAASPPVDCDNRTGDEFFSISTTNTAIRGADLRHEYGIRDFKKEDPEINPLGGNIKWKIDNEEGIVKLGDPKKTVETPNNEVNEFGTCYAWVPIGSPLKGAGLGGEDIGANVLYRYVNGVEMTNQPLWNLNPAPGEHLGAFPHGAKILGVNDIAGSSAFDVHERLHVNTNGCAFPEGYGQLPDTTPPILTLLGTTPVNVPEGATYEDAGATATDAVDGDLTANIVTSGLPIDTTTPGTYTVTYTVSDAAGNAADPVTRTVNVYSLLTLSPTTSSVPIGTGITFLASGGLGTYTFAIADNQSGGSINAVSGAYVAGPTAGLDTVEVTDGNSTATATVTVGLAHTPHDVDGDGQADLVWWDTYTGEVAVWLGNGAAAPTTTGVIGTLDPTSWRMEGLGDLDGDGRADLIWRDPTAGSVEVWLGNGVAVPTTMGVIGSVPPAWVIKGVGDVDGDGRADLVWREVTTGEVAVWLGNGAAAPTTTALIGSAPLAWVIEGVGDVDGDGQADLVWREVSTGEVAVWLGNGAAAPTTTALIGQVLPTSWRIEGVGDLDGDGQADLAWRDTSNGNVAMWLGNGAAAPTIQKSIGNVVPTTWRIESVGDVDGDGQADLTWRNTSNGEVAVWLGNGTTGPTATAVIGSAPTTWEIHPFSDRYETVLTLQTPIPLMVDGQLTEQAWSQAHSVTFQNTPRSDNAVTVASLWDASHLYLAFTVADTLLETDTSSTQLYRDDGVEVYFDPGHEASTALDGNDFHAIVTYLDAATVGGISTATTTSATGYVMEVQIPWTTLSVTPSAGTALGVLLGNNDRDNGSSTQFDWLGLIDHGGYGNPSLWGDLVLSGQVVEDANVAPTVVMGADGTVTLPASATVTATVTDDGLPSSPGQVTTTWSQVSGPGTVTFGEATAVTTAASFDLAGTYVLRLTAHDGQLMSSGELTVTVLPPPPPLTVTVSGTGSGSVTSTPGTINCPSDSCTETFADGTAVTLTATPSSGSTFEGWSGGGCSGTGACTVSLTQAETVTATFTASPPIIPQSQMSVVSASANMADAGKVLDGNLGTKWATDVGSAHEMVLDLGGTYAVSEFRYQPYSSWSRCTAYEVYVSSSNGNWGTAVATGTWENTLGEKTASFAPTEGAFVRVRYTTPSSTSTKSYCFVAEHTVYGTAVVPPSVIPQSQMSVVSASANLNTAPTVLDGNLDTKWATGAGGPHEMVLDLGGTYAVSEFRYQPYSSWSRCTAYEVYVSASNGNWGTAVATGTWGIDAAEKIASFPAKTGAFVRVQYTSGTNGSSYCYAAEHNVVGAATGG